MVNFIPPRNGMSPGNYFLPKSQKLAVFEFFSPFCSASPEIIGLNLTTDNQTNSLTPYIGVCGFFLSVKFATSLLASLTGG